MPELHFILPGNPATRTGGYRYDANIIQGLQQLGWQVNLHCLDASFPNPEQQALNDAAARLQQLPDRDLVVIDGLAFGAMPEQVCAHGQRLRLIALVHHPLALETGLSETSRDHLYQTEQQALTAATRVIVTSPHTAKALADYAVPAKRIGVVLPGVEKPQLSHGTKSNPSSGRNKLQLLCVASLTARKGHQVLIAALAGLQQYPWHLTCVGGDQYDVETVRSIHHQIKQLRLQQRITLAGEADSEQLASHYQNADIFVLASFYEGYGMVLSEALVYGLPIVSTWAGAIPDTVPEQAALLVPPGNHQALATAIAQLLHNQMLRQRLADNALRAGQLLPDWQASSAAFARQLAMLD